MILCPSTLLWVPYLHPAVQLKSVPYMLHVRVTFSTTVLFSIAVSLFAPGINRAKRELLYVVHKSLMLPDASRITVAPTIIAMSRYDNDVRKIASSVPLGIAVCGSCRIQNEIQKWYEISTLISHKNTR